MWTKGDQIGIISLSVERLESEKFRAGPAEISRAALLALRSVTQKERQIQKMITDTAYGGTLF